MRNQIIRKYVHTQRIYDIIGHDIWLYIRTGFTYCFLVVLLGSVYYFGLARMNQPFLQALIGGIGLVAYLKMMYDIFDEYLDTLIITDKGLVHFSRDGLRKQKINMLQWVSIESVSYEQNSFFDSLIDKGDVYVTLEDTTVKFTDVSSPAEVTNKLLEYKDKILGRHNYMENEVEHEGSEKYNILIEALGEVVNEYVEKKKNSDYY